MSHFRTFLIVLSILITTPAAFAQINIVNFDFGAVRIACSNGYTYQAPLGACPYVGPTQNFDQSPGFGWILGGFLSVPSEHVSFRGVGLTGPDTVFYPPPFTGLPFSQAVFLQGSSAFVWQSVGGFSAGTYTLSFYLGSRYIDCCGYDGNQTVVALIDGSPIETWALTSYTPFTLDTATFTVSTSGNHTVQFMGTNPGDHTAFLSYVVITPAERPIH